MADATIARTRSGPRVRVVAEYEACGVEGRDNWAAELQIPAAVGKRAVHFRDHAIKASVPDRLRDELGVLRDRRR